MSMRILKRSFSAGELTPELFARADFPKFQDGLATCRNFITLPHGPAVNRTGTQFVSKVKNSANATRLIPFSYNNTQAFAIELGAGYFRWHLLGATLNYTTPSAYSAGTTYAVGDMCSSSGTNYYCKAATTGNAPPNTTYWYALPSDMTYEIPNPYSASDIMDIKYVQSADVLTLVHPSYPPMELHRNGATNWALVTLVFSPPTNYPTSVTATPTGTGGTPISVSYVVTSVASGTLQESSPSSAGTCSIDLTVSGNYVTIGWTTPSGTAPVRYSVYKAVNGIYGFIGQSSGTTFKDTYITPDMTKTVPIYDTLFGSSNNYPAAVTYYQQRRFFAGTNLAPQNFWGTRSGTESDMSYSIPTRDDNRIAVKIAAREASSILHLVPMIDMLILTATCEWVAAPTSNSSAVTPTSISVSPQSYNGANGVVPIVTANKVLFASARGGHMREMSYSWQSGGFVTQDVSLLAPHLFDYNTILDMAFCRGPIPTVWAVSSNGNLLGMTYVPDQQIAAWHHHDTGIADKFESVCVISENNEDLLYVIVNRTLNGVQTRCVERMASRYYATLSDCFFVDCGATYSGTATTTVSGLTWLEGMTVNILADGAVSPQQVVTGGTITLPVAASKVTIGLPIQADLQTLPASPQVDQAFGQGLMKNVNKVWPRVTRSSGLLAGPDFNSLVQFKQRTTELYGQAPSLVTDEVEIVLTGKWASDGQVCIRQNDPLPLDIASIAIEVVMSGS